MKDEIANAVGVNGATVIVPRDPVTVGLWRGTGYIVDRGADGAAYRITGGTDGGLWWWPLPPDLVAIAKHFGDPDWLVQAEGCADISVDLALIWHARAILLESRAVAWVAAWAIRFAALSPTAALVLAVVIMVLVWAFLIWHLYELQEHLATCEDPNREGA